MQKKVVVPIIFIILFILLACSISYEGITFTDDEESSRRQTGTAIKEMLNAFTEEPPLSGGNAPTPIADPTKVVLPTAVSEPIPEPVTNTVAEYSVTAQNFDCICEETGMVTQEFSIVGDKLYIGDMIYDKVGANTYKRSWMGYYIIVSGEADNQTETQVEESRSSVVILTDSGYIMEHYKGESGSPCCIHTFTKNK